MTVTQLNPPLPLETPKGKGLAHFMIDYGPEHHLMWTVFVTATGECWTFQNPEIRAVSNYTMGRPVSSAIKSTELPWLCSLFMLTRIGPLPEGIAPA